MKLATLAALALLVFSTGAHADTIFYFTISGPTTEAQGVIDAEQVPGPVIEWDIISIAGTFDGSAITGPDTGFDALLDLGDGNMLPFMVFDTTAGPVTWAWVSGYTPGTEVVDVIYPGFAKVEQVTDTFSDPPSTALAVSESPMLPMALTGVVIALLAYRRRREA